MGLFDSLLGADQGSAVPVNDFDRYKAAISANESGGNYGLTGPVTRTGDQAYGKYQVMGSNVGPWTKEALGREMTPAEFLRDPQAQERVFEAKFRQLLTKYGNPQDAASAWFSGRPVAQAGNARDVLGTSVPQYVANFNATLGKQPGQSAMPVDTTAAPAPLGAPDPNALVLPSERYRSLAEAMTQAGLTRPIHGLGDALLGLSNVLQGNAYGSQYEQQQKAYNKAIGDMFAGSANDPEKLRNVLMRSQNPQYQLAGVQSALSPKPQVTFKQLGNDIDGTPLIVAEHPNGKMERVDMSQLPQFAQQKILAGGQMLGPAPSNGQPMTSPEATMAGVGGGFALPQANAAPAATSSQPKMSVADALRSGLSGDDFKNVVKQNSPVLDAQLRSMTNYDMPIAQFRRAQNNPQLMGMAAIYDPSFSASNYEAVQAANKKMAAGTWADTQVAANKAVHHTTQMIQNIPGLRNYDSSIINEATGPIYNQFDRPYQEALGAFNTNKLGVSGELAKVFKGNGQSAEQEIRNWEHNFSEYLGPTKALAATKEGMRMMMGQLDPMADKINHERRKSPGDKGYLTGRDLMDSQHRELFDKIMSIDPQKGISEVERVFGKKAAAPGGAPATPAPPLNAAPKIEKPKGVDLIWNPTTGQLE